MKRVRIIQLLLIFAGVFICLLAIFFDLLKGKSTILFGPLHWLGLIAGFVLIAIGIFFPSLWSKPMYFRIKDILNREIPNIDQRTKKHWIFDILAFLIFLFIAIAFFVGRWKGVNPVIDLGPDAANVATYAAVLDHPQNFASDFLYQSTNNFSYYVSLHIPYLRFFNPILGGYGLAYLSLLIPIIFIQLSGFYTFGKLLYKNRFWAFLLSVISLVIIFTESSDYWGIYKDPQPRMLFGAFFPWLLSAAYLSLQKPGLRYFTMAFMGLLLYVHPVSAPGVAFAIWLGFLLFKPKGKTTGRHLFEMFLLGLIFVVTAIPFTLTYLNSRDIVPKGINYSTALAAFQSTGIAMFHVTDTLVSFLKNITIALLLPLALLAWVLGWVLNSKRIAVKLILIWLCGLLAVSIGITLIEPIIDAELHIMPVLLQLTRDLRYVVPLLEISVFLLLAECSNAIPIKSLLKLLTRGLLAISGIFIVVLLVWGYKNVTVDVLDMKGYAQQAVKCWLQGDFFCPTNSSNEEQDLLAFIKNSPDTNASYFSLNSESLDREIRYESLRSIAFDNRDRNTFLAVNISKYIELTDEFQKWEEIQNIQDQKLRLLSSIDFAKEVGAKYAIIAAKDQSLQSYPVIYASDSYAIIDLSTR